MDETTTERPKRLNGCRVTVGGKSEYRHFECVVDLISSAADDIPMIACTRPRAETAPRCGKCGGLLRFVGD